MPCWSPLQVSVIRKVEVEIEAALDKLKAATKDLQKGQRDALKLVAEDQKEYAKYAPGMRANAEGQCLWTWTPTCMCGVCSQLCNIKLTWAAVRWWPVDKGRQAEAAAT